MTVSSNPNASDERTLGDWFDDAVDVLRDVAGVLLVSAAILIPIGLIAAIVGLGSDAAPAPQPRKDS